ncbi:MAG: COG4223 family protein [Alphaproteobacteria bacterium]
MNSTSENPNGDGTDGDDGGVEASAHGGEDNGHVDALPLIARFGGIRPMAAKLGVPVSTVQGWKERDAVPVNRLEAIKAAARQHDIGLTPEDVILQVEAEAAPDTATDSQTKMAEKTAGKETADLKPSAGKLADEKPQLSQNKLVLVVSLAALVIAVLSVLASLFAMLPGEPGLTALEDRVAALEAAPVGSPDGNAAVDALKGRIAVLETVVEAGVDGVDAEAVEARLSAAEQAVAAAAGGADLLALADRVDAAESALGEAATALAERVSAVEDAVQAGGRSPNRRAVAIAPAGPEAVAAGAAVDLAPVTARLAALERALAGLAEQVQSVDETPDVTVDAAALEERLARLEQELAELADQPIIETDRAIGLTLAAIQLRAALGSGEVFEDAFLRARALAVGDEALGEVLEPLAPLALTGVATLEALSGDFDMVARILTLAAAEAEGGWTDRMIARLNAVVSVRRTDAEPGDDGIGARVARTRVRLEAGDPARALSELGPPGLGEDERVAAWRDAVAGRLAVDRAIAALENFAYANLADTSVQ